MPKTLLVIFSCHQYDYKHSEYQDWYTRPVTARVEGIRASWLKDVDVDYKIFYGRPPKRYKEVARGNIVGLELDKSFRDPREDEVFLDVNDGYYYSAEKIRAIIRYALDKGYDRIVKVDDDVYVYWGRLMANAPEDAWVGGGSPNAIAGPCYWLSKSSLQILNANSAPHWAEDAWVGTVLLNNNVTPRFDSRYYIAPQTKNCQYISDEELSKPNDYLTIHSLSPAADGKIIRGGTMQKVKCYTSSSIGPCPTLCDNFSQHDISVSIYWDDAIPNGCPNDGCQFRVMHQCEPSAVLNIVDRLLANWQHYDLIMGFDERVLKLPNAVFLTESSCSWMDRKSGKSPAPFLHHFPDVGLAPLSPVVYDYKACDVSAKKFAVSFLTSSKGYLPGHILRQEIFNRLPAQVGSLPVWKHRSPPRIEDKRTILEPYMFSICPENSRQSGYYTEKIVDCFIAKTIPIYRGCTDLNRHFNLDGVIQFENYDDLIAKLQSLTPEFYRDREPAIEENFRRALQGVHQWDLIEGYIAEGIRRKYGNPASNSLAQ